MDKFVELFQNLYLSKLILLPKSMGLAWSMPTARLTNLAILQPYSKGWLEN